MARMARGPARGPVYRSTSMPAPVNGWSSQYSQAEAGKLTALVLDNWFPESDAIRSRRGCVSQVTGIAGGIGSLLVYNSASGGRRLFAATQANIYDVTSTGAAGAAVLSSLSSSRWSQEMFSTSGGQFLVACNGSDGVRTYDGSVWVDRTPSITGTSGAAANFDHVCAHKGRLWFVEKNSTNLWYLDTFAVQGAANPFPVGAFLKLGGKIVSCATWSSNQGYALDDRLVVITDQGECLIYTGSDPSGAGDWELSLRFVTSPPLGNRCFFTVGADLLVLTEAGLFPLSQIVEVDQAALATKGFTTPIRRAFTDAVKAYGSSAGWEITSLPVASMALVNVPGLGQFALNTLTGKWGRFTGWNASCWAYFDGGIYYGTTGGNVFRAEYGPNDNGDPIPLTVVPAFTPLGEQGRLKFVKMIRPILKADVLPPYSMGVAVNYKEPTLFPNTESYSAEGWLHWDISTWDGPDVWKSVEIDLQWQNTGNVGTVISPAFAVNLDAGGSGNDFDYRLIAFDILYEIGEVV